MSVLLLWLLVWSMVPVLAPAQSVSIPARQWTSEHYSIRNGMPTNFVKDIYVAADGKIWLATDFGLVMVEGRSLQVYREQFNSPLLKQVLPVAGGRLAAITPRDALVWDRAGTLERDGRLAKVSNARSDSTIHAPGLAFYDGEGGLWFSEPEGVSRLLQGDITRFMLPVEARSASFYRNHQFVMLRGGRLLISAQSGFFWIYELQTRVLRAVPILNRPAGLTVDALTQLADGTLLTGGDAGIFELTYTDQGFLMKPIHDFRQVVKLLPVSLDQVWAGSKTAGARLLLRNQDGWSLLDSLPPVNRLKDLELDDDGNIWVASDEGAFCFYKSLFTPLVLPGDDGFINDVAVLSPSRFNASSRNRIWEVIVTPGRIHASTRYQSNGRTVTSMFHRRDSLWVSFLDGGYLVLPDPGGQPSFGTFETPGPLKAVKAGSVTWLISEMDGRILRKGLNQILPDTIQVSDHPQAAILKVKLDQRNDRLFVAVADSGLYLNIYNEQALEPERTIDFSPRTPDGYFSIIDMEGTDNGALWLATTQGICRLLPDQPAQEPVWLDFPPGFPFHLIRDLFVDVEGKMWIAAEHGLFVFYDGALTRFDRASGLLHDLVTTVRTSDRGLIVGHSNGLSVWPGLISFEKTRVIPRLKTASGSPVGWSDRQVSVSADAQFTFNATAAAYPARQVVIQYRLDGSAWQEADDLGSFSFPALEQGEHILELRAIRAGREAGAIRTYSLQVEASWYRTWPAFMAEGLLLVMLFTIGYRLRAAVLIQRRTLRNLEQTRAQIQTVIANAPVLLFVLDRFGNLRLLEGKALNSMDVSPEKWQGKPVTELFSDWLFTTCVEGALMGTESTVIVERASRAYDVHLIPVPDEEGKFRVNGIGVDITEQVMTERRLRIASEEAGRAREAAENANRAKSQFLANMSHELRTPLNAIIGYAQVLDKDVTIGDRQRHFIRTMRESGFHLLGMINDILDLSKIESGQMELKEQAVSLRKFLQDMDDMFRLQAESQGLVFEVRTEQGLPVALVTDAHKLRQVVINLISNSVKYTERGFVRVVVSRRESVAGPKVCFCVEDSGRGIPPEQLEEVFKPFKQVQGVFNKGTGLGLTIVKNIAALMHGEIEVQSEPGRGSTFCLVLPLQEAVGQEQPMGQKPRYEVKSGVQVSALVVDDVLSNRELICEMLRSTGITVRVAADGPEALRLLQEQVPDVLLLDLNMPGLNGHEVLAIIRSEIEKKVPIIAVTAQGMQEHRDNALRAGFDAFIAKPFLLNDLMEAIHVVTGGVFTRPVGLELSGEINLNDPVLLRAWFAALEPNTGKEWLDALELTDLNAMDRLAATTNPPLDLERAVRGRDYRYLFSIDEILRQN